MDKFMILDLSLLIIFVLFISQFLYRNRKNLKKDGLLWLYHTKWGTNLIEKTGKKYKRLLTWTSYVSVTIGYILMVVIVWMVGKIVWLYAFHGDLVRAVKVPPIMPLIPYLPQIFKLDFLPSFYFSYWIIILAVIAITHELFHGIYASLNNVKTKTTGFGFFPFFFPVLLAAFVNLDEKAMDKRKNFQQRAVLSAGTFANILTTILGILLMFGFFTLAFSPSGIVHDDYAYKVVNIEDIESINGIMIDWDNYNISQFDNFSKFSKIKTKDESFVAMKGIFPEENAVILYYDAPAINSDLKGVIKEINSETITSLNSLTENLEKYKPGEEVSLLMFDGENETEIIIELGENPNNKEKAWLGISFIGKDTKGVMKTIIHVSTLYKKSNVYYEANFELAKFIYDLLWWLVIISFSVALVNMLPMGIFDGGRFFYLTVLQITKSKKVAEIAFKRITQLFLLALAVVMVFWFKNLF